PSLKARAEQARRSTSSAFPKLSLKRSPRALILDWTRKRPYSPTTAPSSSGPARGSDACHRKWLPSSIRRVDCGRAALSMARSVRLLLQTATQHGGQEMTLFSIITNLLHFGMTIVGLPYSHLGQMTLDEIVGGAPYGSTTIAGGQGERKPSAIELAGARHQGALTAKTANKLFG